MYSTPRSLCSLLLALATLLLGAALVPAATVAQTPAATVKDGSNNARLQSFFDGGLLAPGVFGPTSPADSIPAEGSGTRMMWYPAKAAFRAGQVAGTQWNASEIGKWSIALGLSSKATADYSTAIGARTKAKTIGSSAIGYQVAASTFASFSIGRCNNANSGSSGDGTLFVVGNGPVSGGACDSNSDALVLDKSGNLTTAASIESESGGFVLPDGTTLKGSADLGLRTNSNGASVDINADGLLAIGEFGTGGIPTSGSGTRMMWYPAKAAFRAGEVTGTHWDDTNVGDYSVAFGFDTRALGNQAAAMGKETVAATNNSVTIGKCNSANSGTSGDGNLFVVGNGLFDSGRCTEPDDALVLDDQGNLTVSSQGTFSDRRLKSDIEPIGEGILQKLSRLRPVRYEFKNQETRPSGEQLGLIAQDVRKEFPSLVSESGGYLSLAYPKLTAVLLKGLQEQQSQIEQKNEQIAELRANQMKIQKRLAALDAGRSPSVIAGLSGTSAALLLAFLCGGLFGAALLHVRRS